MRTKLIRKSNTIFIKVDDIKAHKKSTKFRIKRGLKINLDCEFCEGPITGNPHVYRFADYERFFCCKGCLSGYKQKYTGRIESIKRKFDERE